VHPERHVDSAITQAAFNCRCDALAALNEHGQVIGLELQHNRYTLLKRGGSSGMSVAYSGTLATELFIGLADGSIECFDTEKRIIVGTLRGHRRAIRSLHCHRTQPLLLSCSADAMVLWSTRNMSRMRHLAAGPSSPLVCAALPPSGDHVLACLEHKVRVWRSSDFAAVATHKLPASYASLRLRALAVNGSSSMAAAAGEFGLVALLSLRTHEMLKLLQMPAGSSIGQAIWMLGSDHLALVCDDGTLQITQPTAEEVSLVLRPEGGKAGIGFVHLAIDVLGHSMAAVRTDGTLALHSLEPLARRISGRQRTAGVPALLSAPKATPPSSTALARPVERLAPAASSALPPPVGPPQTEFHRAAVENGGVNLAKLLPLYQVGALPDSSPLLDVRRLRGVLRRTGRFPDKHRILVWRFLLQLPHNVAAHRGLADKGPHSAHAALHARTSLRDRRLSGRLERALSCLAHWCPLFGEAADLDAAVFPWVLAFDGDEVATFEAAATVLANWGQRFFECYPYPPVELLAAVASLLSHHAPVLAAHLEMIGADTLQWAWPLLASFFSRSLAHDDWLVLWDHLLSHEPVFMLVAVVAYAKLHAPALLQARSAQHACEALHAESCLRLRLWMRTANAMLRGTPDHFFLRWAPFSPLPAGPIYPRRVAFPKSAVDFGFAEVARIKASEAELMQRRYLVARALAASQEADAAAEMSHKRRQQMEAEEAAAREALAARQAHLERLSRGQSFAVDEAAVAGAEAAAQRARMAGAQLEMAHAQRMARLEVEMRAAETAAISRSGQCEDATKRVHVPEIEAAKEAAFRKPGSAVYEEVNVTLGIDEDVKGGGLAGRGRGAEHEELRQTIPSSLEQQATSLAARCAAVEAHSREARPQAEAAEPVLPHDCSGPAATRESSISALAPEHLVAQASFIQPFVDTASAVDAPPAPERALNRTHSSASVPSVSAAEGGASPPPHPSPGTHEPRLVYGSRHSDHKSHSAASDDGAQFEELLHALRQQRAEHRYNMESESEAVLKRLLLQHGVATASTTGGDAAAPASGVLAPAGGISPIVTAGVHGADGHAGPPPITCEQLGKVDHFRSPTFGLSTAEPRGAHQAMQHAERLSTVEASVTPNFSAQRRKPAFAGPLAQPPTADELPEDYASSNMGAAMRSAVCCQYKEVPLSSAREPSATVSTEDFHAFVPPGSPTRTAQPSSALLTAHGFRLDGIGSHLRARLASEARAGRASAEYLTPGAGSAASGAKGRESNALGGLRLSGLPTGLQQQLRGLAEEGRALGLEMAVTGTSSDSPGMWPLQSSTNQAHQHARTRGNGFNPWSRGQIEDEECSDASPCAMCELLADQFDSHEAWVESLRAGTEAVLATHTRAQEGLASLMPSHP
jgi:hypothetical protein